MVSSAVHQLDEHGANVEILRRRTPAGLRADQVVVSCPTDHPTGVTVTMLQAISAVMLRGDTNATESFDSFVAGLRSTSQWIPGKRNRTSDKLLHELAAVYNKALVAQHPPLQVVARWLGSSVPTASTLIREARRRQLIKEVPRPGRPMKKK